jgi:predicted metal-binding membrane protein
VIQFTLHSLALLSPDMRAASPYAGAALLIAGGIYQWLPVKQSCLAHCRSPLGFLSTSWREGRAGAVMMGVTHGAFCVGCCWMLMALLFVAGVMNLVWVAALSIVVLLEKVMPGGQWIARGLGIVLILSGVMLLV